MRRRRLVARQARGRLAMALLVVCGLGGTSRLAWAGSVGDYLGRPIVEVRVQSEGAEVRDESLFELLETRVGAPLAMTEVRETLAHLFGLGRYQDIQVDASLRGDAVVLVYELVPFHHVRRILFRGPLGLSEGALRSAVIERYGVSPPVGRAAEAARTIEALYRDRGYLHAAVTPRTEIEHRPERTTLIFDVSPGVRTRIRSIDVKGTPLLSREQLLDRLELRESQPYDRTAVTARLLRYVDELHGRGYYEAKIDHVAEFTDDGQIADLVVVAEPGPRVTIAFEGDPLAPREREELVPIAREHSVDEDLLEDSKLRIEASLHDRGYREAQADYRRTESEGALRIVFTVRRGPQYSVARVEVSGNASVPLADLRPLIQLKEGEPFVESTVDADISRIADLYRRRGFAGIRVTAQIDSVGGVGQPDQARSTVTTRILVMEGVRTLIRSMSFEGNSAIGTEGLQAAIASLPGQPYYEPQLAVDRDTITLQYLNRGYENAAVQVDVKFGDDRSAVDLRFLVQEGAQVLVDHVLIVGNLRTSSQTIEREILLKRGQPLALSDLTETQRRLTALGLFRRVRITDLRHPGSDTPRDILVTVEEGPATTIGYGGGVQGGKRLRRTTDGGGQAVERFEFAPSGFFEVGRRNLWGKNRSVNLFTRVSFRPRGESTAGPTGLRTEGSGYGFNEYRVLGTYREPKVFGWNTDALVTGSLEQAIRSSFNFSRRRAQAEMARRLTPRVSLSGRYSFDRIRLFDERISPPDQPLIDRLFPQVRLSAFSSSLIRDTRDDNVDPSRGALVGLDGEIATGRGKQNVQAAQPLDSKLGFVKTFLQGFLYRKLPGGRRVVFAGGARLGLADAFLLTDLAGRPVIGSGGKPESDLPASERFYAGGDTTVRGFALDRLGTPETIAADGFPKGGNALLVFNTELRVPVWRAVGAVGFIDAGNVFAHASDLDLREIRGAVGFGLRYRSPVGPIRVDLGFKLDRRCVKNCAPTGEGPIPPRELERLTALHISLGQAF